MKRITSLLLCLLLLVPCFVCAYADDSQSMAISASVPQMQVTVSKGAGYEVYYGEEQVDGTTFSVDRFAEVTLDVKLNSGKYLIHSTLNGTPIYTENGDGHTLVITAKNPVNNVNLTVADVKDAHYEGVFEQNTQFLASLTLNDSIDINFTMKNLCSSFDLEKYVVTVDGQALTLTQENMPNGNFDCVLATKAPQNIGEEIECVMQYDGHTMFTFTYSAKDYCADVLDPASGCQTTEPELYNLCKLLLNYGERAQTYFGAEDKIQLDSDKRIDFGNSSYAVPKPESKGGFTPNAKITAAGANLDLGSTTTMSFFIKTDLELTKEDIIIRNELGKFVDEDNIVFEKTTGDYNYKISIKNIGASKLARTYTLTIEGIAQNSFCIVYSAYDYCYAAENKEENLKLLCRAVYAYAKAATAYEKA